MQNVMKYLLLIPLSAVCMTVAVTTTPEEFLPCQWTYYECQSRGNDPDWSTNCYWTMTSTGSCYDLCSVNPESGSCVGYCEEFLSKCTTTQNSEIVRTIAPTVSPTVVSTIGGPSGATTTSPNPTKEIHGRSVEFVPCQWTSYECQSRSDNSDWSINCYRGATGPGSCYNICSDNPESGGCRGYCEEFLSKCPEEVPTIVPTLSPTTTSNAGSPSVATTTSPNPTTASSLIELDYTGIEAEQSTRTERDVYRALFFFLLVLLCGVLCGVVIYYKRASLTECFQKLRARRIRDIERGRAADDHDNTSDDSELGGSADGPFQDASHIESNKTLIANVDTPIKYSPAAKTDPDTDSDAGLLNGR